MSGGWRRGLAGVATAWLVFLVEPLSRTGLDFPLFFGVFGISVVVSALALVVVLSHQPVRPLALVGWLAHPLAVAALLAIFIWSQSPANPLFRLRFHVSRPALDELVRAALASAPTETSRWVGLFPIRRVSVHPPEVWLVSAMCGVVDECGFLYAPASTSVRRPKTRLGHLGGPWHHLYAIF